MYALVLLLERFVENVYPKNIQIEFVRQKFPHDEYGIPILNYNSM